MNDILAAYENARFPKAAAEPADVPGAAVPAAGAVAPFRPEMTDALRRIRDAIEQSVRTEARLREQARQTAEWGKQQVMTPAEGGWITPGRVVGATGVAAGAGLGKYLQQTRPTTASLESAISKVMAAEKDFPAFVRRHLTRGKYSIPEYAPEVAHALQTPYGVTTQGGVRGLLAQLKARLLHGSSRAVDPSVADAVLKTKKGVPNAFSKVLDKSVTGATGREKVRKAIMEHEAVTKGKGAWSRSGAVKGGLTAAALMALAYYGPDLWKRMFSDVSPETEKATKLMQKKMQLAQLIHDWRQAQLQRISEAKAPEEITPVEWAPYAERIPR